MQPDAHSTASIASQLPTHAPVLDESLPQVNHRTLSLLVMAFGIVGCVLEVAGPPPLRLPRLVLFLGVVAAGVVYLARVVRRSRRARLGEIAAARRRACAAAG